MSTDEGGQNPLDEPTKFTVDVARIYYPLETAGSSLWQTSLQTMRERFADVVRNQGRLACVLTQSIIPAPKLTERPDPPETAGMEPYNGRHGGPRREPRQLFIKRENGEETVVSDVGELLQKSWQLRILDKSQKIRCGNAEYEPLVGDRPVYDLLGNPILFHDGDPVALQLGTSRNYTVYADAGPDRAAVCESFYSTAAEAGRGLYGLPADVNRILWRDWLDGFWMLDGTWMWINALFELAWQCFPGSPLTAKKYVWSGSARMPLDTLSLLRRQGEHSGPMELLADIPDPPAHWYSVLENLPSASIAAVDILLAIGDEMQARQGELVMEVETPPPSDGTSSTEDDDVLPAKKRKLSPSRVKAKSLYDWAMSEINGAEDMTIDELYKAIESHPSDGCKALPPNAATFGRYLRDTGVRKYSGRKGRAKGKSVQSADDL